LDSNRHMRQTRDHFRNKVIRPNRMFFRYSTRECHRRYNREIDPGNFHNIRLAEIRAHHPMLRNVPRVQNRYLEIFI